MPKHILIFSDGTGQVGGLRPDQRLSNVYKMYRAMRPGPDSPISTRDQVCYYDPGLGSGETGGFSYQRAKNLIASALGAGIDDNVIDCYEKIISYYEPGDQVSLIGFSRGAYTARAVANVMNLCGVPTTMPDGGPVPRGGPRLRKIAADAVLYVYNYGNGRPRGKAPFFEQREELARRFRRKYGSFIPDAERDVQGNVQPTFIGVFDTVAALGNKTLGWVLAGIGLLLMGLIWLSWTSTSPWFSWAWPLPLAALLGVASLWVELLISQFKFFSPDPERRLKLTRPGDWPTILRNCHFAFWDRENYDRWLDGDVRHARHAIAIDEHRTSFPRVPWGSGSEYRKTAGRKPAWLKQVWFAGCHSDVGGSYPEPESRLSDIALDWMIEEMKECLPELRINEHMLNRNGDPLGLQHEETFFIPAFRIRWPTTPRKIDPGAALHPTVIERMEADAAPQMGEMKPYRPRELAGHKDAKRFFEAGAGE